MVTRYEKLFELSIGLLATVSTDGFFTNLNPAWTRVLGWSVDELKARPFIEFVHPDDREGTQVEAAKLFGGQTTICFENRYHCKDGSFRHLLWNAEADMSEEASSRIVYATAHDITAQRQAVEQLRANESKLREALQSMSTPLIPITSRIVVMPLVGLIDAERAGQVMNAALAGVQGSQTEVVILDVTGLREIDSDVASAIVSTAQALRLLGARTVLTGIQPAVAQTLIRLSLDLAGITTHGTLQSAIAAALGRATL